MTTKELIEQLSTAPPDAVVEIFPPDDLAWGYAVGVVAVRGETVRLETRRSQAELDHLTQLMQIREQMLAWTSFDDLPR